MIKDTGMAYMPIPMEINTRAGMRTVTGTVKANSLGPMDLIILVTGIIINFKEKVFNLGPMETNIVEIMHMVRYQGKVNTPGPVAKSI